MIAAVYQRLRIVSPEPPHEPEPYPDEPFAPVYDFVPPLGHEYGRDRHLRSPRQPDPLVFGAPYWPEAVAHPPLCEQRRCACGAGWHDHEGERTACWACGRTG